jgi:hypothetical protein
MAVDIARGKVALAIVAETSKDFYDQILLTYQQRIILTGCPNGICCFVGEKSSEIRFLVVY